MQAASEALQLTLSEPWEEKRRCVRAFIPAILGGKALVFAQEISGPGNFLLCVHLPQLCCAIL